MLYDSFFSFLWPRAVEIDRRLEIKRLPTVEGYKSMFTLSAEDGTPTKLLEEWRMGNPCQQVRYPSITDIGVCSVPLPPCGLFQQLSFSLLVRSNEL